MRDTFFAAIIFTFLFYGCRTTKPINEVSGAETHSTAVLPATNFYNPETWILGYFTRSRMERPPHSEWFVSEYDNYHFSTDIVNRLTNISKNDIIVRIVLGTWCPDSRREVPRFMRLMDLWKFPSEKITFIGTDLEKLSPIGEYEKLNIERVPTFIFYKNNIELGRIIETPVASLEQDMVNILTRNE